ncbi:hypothetical protein D3C87_1537180 [compost metagenome]
MLQFDDVLRKVLGTGIHVASKRAGGAHVGAGSAAEAEIDTAGQQRFQCTELFSNHERRMVWQHHTARAEMQRRGIGGKIANQHRRCGAGNAHHIMVFRQPVAMIAALFRETGKIQRVREGVLCRRTFGNRCQVQHRKRNGFISHNSSLCRR